jgi:hypothetical protein
MGKLSLFDRLRTKLEADNVIPALEGASGLSVFNPLALSAESSDSTETIPDENSVPDPVTWASFVAAGPLDPWQAQFMVNNEPHVLMNCARQVGKSQIVSLKCAYNAVFRSRRVVVIAPTLRQSTIIHRRARRWLFNGSIGVEEVGYDLFIQGGGQITALPGDRPDLAIRGDTIDDLIVDEASRVKSQLIAAATPATATRSDASITYLSTPAGRQGDFWKAWSEQDWWHKIKVMASECPRIDTKFLERERRRLGPLYAQEYECEFLDTFNALFSAADLDAVFQREEIRGVTSDIEEMVPIW